MIEIVEKSHNSSVLNTTIILILHHRVSRNKFHTKIRGINIERQGFVIDHAKSGIQFGYKIRIWVGDLEHFAVRGMENTIHDRTDVQKSELLAIDVIDFRSIKFIKICIYK
jgi:hypothetical protein